MPNPPKDTDATLRTTAPTSPEAVDRLPAPGAGRLANWAEVQAAEQEQLAIRRQQAGLDPQLCNPENIRADAVGVALSGGGIRSGAVSLGFLQALERLGMLRWVDYLSTVSGGGYAGAFWSSATMTAERGTQTRTSPTGQQTDRVQRLVFNGKYLARFQFFGHHKFGLLLTLTMCVSGLVSLMSLAAFVMRWLDHPQVRNWVNALRISDDLIVYELPALVLFGGWLICWLLYRLRARWRCEDLIASEHWPVKVMFWSWLLAVVAGLGVILSTNDLDLNSFARVFGVKTTDRSLSSIVSYLLPAILTGLLPYLQPKRLINSGLAPRNIGEKFAFNFASIALFVGVPFLALCHYAKENVSEHNQRRSGMLVAGDLNDVGYDEHAPEWQRLFCFLPLAERQAIRQKFAEIDRFNAEVGWLESRFPSGIRAIRTAYQRQRDQRHEFIDYLNEQLIGNRHLVQTLFDLEPHHVPGVDRLQEVFECKLKQSDNAQIANLTTDEIRQLVQDLQPLCQDTAEVSGKLRELEAFEAQLPSQNMTAAQLKYTQEQLRDELWSANRRLVVNLMGLTSAQTRRIGPASVLLADQGHRLKTAVVAALLFLGVLLVMNLNYTSLHPFYRQRLSANWIEKMPVSSSPAGREPAEPLLQHLKTVQHGSPYHLIGGSAYLMSFPQRQASDYIPDPFLFSQQFCGTPRIGFARTDGYLGGQLTLADATAMSGAAVSPIQQPRLLIRLILFATNLRMGQWLPHPAAQPHSERPLHQYYVTPFSAIWRAFQIAVLQRDPAQLGMFLVTDGGHQENLGIGALIERRCRLILAIDASADERFALEDFSRLVRWARVRRGIQLTPLEQTDVQLLTPSSLAPESDPDLPAAFSAKLSPTASPAAAIEALINDQADKTDRKHRWSKSHVMACEIHYPDRADPGLLLYFKTNMTGDEPIDLRQHALNNPAFPHDSTADQFFSPDQFDAYRQLGQHVLESLSESLRRPSHLQVLERIRIAYERWQGSADACAAPGSAVSILQQILAENLRGTP